MYPWLDLSVCLGEWKGSTIGSLGKLSLMLTVAGLPLNRINRSRELMIWQNNKELESERTLT